MKFAIIKTGGKQYFVKNGDEIFVENLNLEPKSKIELDCLAVGDIETNTIEMGTPFLKEKVSAEVLENLKGDKLRISKFKAKTRYRKIQGFRHHLSKIKISI